MPLQPAIRLLLFRAEHLEAEIAQARQYPSTTTLTQQAQMVAEVYACRALVRLAMDATGDEREAVCEPK